MANRPTQIIVHHTAASSPVPQFAAINDWHRARAFPQSRSGHFVGYHYVIERDGTVKQARQDDEVGAHTVGANLSSIGVALVGNFNHEPPTEEQTEALARLLSTLVHRHGILPSRIFPHRKFKQTDCYGQSLDDEWALRVYLHYEIDRLTHFIAELEALRDRRPDAS